MTYVDIKIRLVEKLYRDATACGRCRWCHGLLLSAVKLLGTSSAPELARPITGHLGIYVPKQLLPCRIPADIFQCVTRGQIAKKFWRGRLLDFGTEISPEVKVA